MFYDILTTFLKIFGRMNFIIVHIFQLLFNQSQIYYSSVFFASYLLMKDNQNKHINVGVIILFLICIALNWSSNLWINSIFAAVLSLEFIIYFSVAIVYAKNAQNIILYSVFDLYVQGVLFVILVVFDILFFNNEKSIVLILISFLLPVYRIFNIRILILMLFILDFALYLAQIDYYKQRMPYTIYTTLLYCFTFIIIFDVANNLKSKFF
jgi:hypothetical protein